MDIENLRKKVFAEEYSITTHAFIEARKDGINPYDIEYVLKNGKIIESYQKWFRCLISGIMKNKIPLHIVCDYYDFANNPKEDIRIITVYIPDRDRWISDKKRKESK